MPPKKPRPGSVMAGTTSTNGTATKTSSPTATVKPKVSSPTTAGAKKAPAATAGSKGAVKGSLVASSTKTVSSPTAAEAKDEKTEEVAQEKDAVGEAEAPSTVQDDTSLAAEEAEVETPNESNEESTSATDKADAEAEGVTTASPEEPVATKDDAPKVDKETEPASVVASATATEAEQATVSSAADATTTSATKDALNNEDGTKAGAAPAMEEQATSVASTATEAIKHVDPVPAPKADDEIVPTQEVPNENDAAAPVGTSRSVSPDVPATGVERTAVPLLPTATAVDRAALVTTAAVEGVLAPLNATLTDSHLSQQELSMRITAARRKQQQVAETLARVEPTFSKIPAYVAKLEQIKRNMDTLEFNVKKLRRQACDVKSEVDDIFAPKLHPVQRK